MTSLPFEKMNAKSARSTGRDRDVLSARVRGSLTSLTQRYPSAGVRSVGNGSVAGSVYASTILTIESQPEASNDFVDWDDDGRHIGRLNDQQWVLQRKKIGLSRRTEKIEYKKQDSESKKRKKLKFFRSFKRKECVKFVPDPTKKKKPRGAPSPKKGQIAKEQKWPCRPCYCGAPEYEHKKRATYVLEEKNQNRKDETILEEEEESDAGSSKSNIKVGSMISSLMSLDSIKYLPPIPNGDAMKDKVDGWLETNKILPFPLSPNASEYDQSNEKNEMQPSKTEQRNGISNIQSNPVSTNEFLEKSKLETSTLKEKNDLEKDLEEEWNEETAIQEFPTNAVGEIHFINEDEGSIKPSKYIRLSDSTPMEKVKTLLLDYWNIFKPNHPHLALSLVGGAKNFRLEGRKKETFKDGLISAAKSTNALILTGGSNTGAMKLVGEAVRDGQYMIQDNGKMTRGIKLLALCSWGYVKDHTSFVNDNMNDFHTCSYNANVEVRAGDGNVPLNGDHTHFLMVDDGSRYRFFGKSTDFITRFEEMVRSPDGLGLPIVTILLEGGKDAIRIVKERLKIGISCIVIEGSGRAADIIGYAYKNATKHDIDSENTKYKLREGHIKEIKKMIYDAYGANIKNGKQTSYQKEDMRQILGWVFECIQYSDIITLFDIRREAQLDKKILSGLLKGTGMELKHQLYLSMIWDRIDIAEEKIFANDSLQLATGQEASDIMLKAILFQRKEFIDLLIMNGFLMQSFLTVKNLRILYQEGARGFKELQRQIRTLVGTSRGEIRLNDIHNFFCYIFKDHKVLNYKLDVLNPNYANESNESCTFKDPYSELFFWSILSNKPMLVDFFWQRSDHPILNSLIAAGIYSRLSHWYRVHLKYDDYEKVLPALKLKFQTRAIDLIDIAFRTDPMKVNSLLERRNQRWGNRNMIEISYIAHLRVFVASPWCVDATESAWRRGFVRLPWYACLLFLCPFVAWTPLVKFTPGLGDDGGNLNPFQKIFVFYKAPIVKYVGTCISYLIFLLLYSYVVLFGFRYEFQIPELIVYAWIGILILDEMREYIIEPSKSAHGKLRDYVGTVWNKFDLSIYLLAVMAFILRNFYETFWLGRIVMVFNGPLFFFRVFRVYHASWKLGPKLIIIHRMIPEIIIFVALLVIFIIAYGVANQAIIDPYRDLEWKNIGPLLYDIMVLPYWQMYGDLQLETLQIKQPMYNSTTECRAVSNMTEFIKNGNNNTSICLEPDVSHSDDFKIFTHALLVLYLLIAHVMLLNLLIAIFTTVFEQINVNSNEVWKWEKYRLVGEYDQRPGLPAPLVVIELIYKVVKSIWKKTCRRRKENLELYMQETIENLRMFEKECASVFISREESKEHNSLEKKMYNLENKMMQILEYFDDKPDDSANWGIAISSLDELKDDSDENESHRLDSDAIQNKSKNISGAERKKLESTVRKKSVDDHSVAGTIISDPFEKENQSVIVNRIKEDICGIKEDISLLDKTMEDHQHRNNKRFDKIESDVASIKKMAKTLTNDNNKILDILVNLSKHSIPKDTKSAPATNESTSNSSHKRKAR